MNISSFLSPLDTFIIVFFLLVTLVLGFRAGRGTKSVRDYAIANKRYATPILFMTLMATFIGGGSTTGIVAGIYKNGGIFVLALFGFTLSQVIAARYIAPKFDERFEGMISVGDIIRVNYGKSVEKFSALIICIQSIGIITAQIVALGHLTQVVTGLEYKFSMLIMGMIMISYSAFGGIKAVTITDVLQFAILVVTIPILAQIVLSDAGNFGNIITKVKEVAPHQLQISGNPKSFDYFALFILYLMPISLKPVAIQRFLMAKDKRVISKLLYGYAFMDLCMIFITTCIAFSAIILLEDVNPKEIIPTFIMQYLPIGMKGLVIAGMIAAIMSTADSILNTAGVTFAHNLMPKKYNNIKWLRVFTFFIGIITLLIALLDLNIVQTVVVSNSLLLLAVVLPTVMVILRFKVTPSSYWVPIGIALPIFILGQFVFHYGFKSQLAAIVVAAVVSVLMIMAQNKWKDYFIPHESGIKQHNKCKLNKLLHNWRKKIDESINNVSAPFAIFALTAFTLPYFMWSSYNEHNVLLRVIAGFLCICLLMRDYYPTFLKKYYSFLWILTITYCLPFMTTVVVLIEGDSLWLINLALSVFLLSAIVDWMTFITVASVGVLIGLLYVLTFGNVNILWESSSTYSMIYTVIFSTLIGLVFNRTRERVQKNKIDDTVLFAEAMAHELKTPLSAASMSLGMVKTILSSVDRSSGKAIIQAKELDELNKFLDNTEQSLNSGVYDIDMLLTAAAADKAAHDFSEYKMSDIIHSVKHDVQSVYSQYSNRILFIIEDDFTFIGSEKMMQHVLLNLIDNAVKYALSSIEGTEVKINVYRNKVEISDAGNGVSNDIIQNLFSKGASTASTGLGLAFCKKIMYSIGGQIEYRPLKNMKGARFVLTFPEAKQITSD